MFLDERDLEIIPILLSLSELVDFKSEPRPSLGSLSWGCTKRRNKPAGASASTSRTLSTMSESPVSPLSFSPNKFIRSSSNPKKSKKTSFKRKRVEHPDCEYQVRMTVQQNEAPVKTLSAGRQEAPNPALINQRPSFTVQMMGPDTSATRGIDLNLPPAPDVDVFQPPDLFLRQERPTTASATKEARRRRIVLIRSKKPSSGK